MDLKFISITELIEDKKRLVLASIVIVLIAISWLGILDFFSYDYLNGSLLSALSSYTVSRTLNGVISVLQSSSLSVGIASVTVGELLDPVNDIVEKFSELLMLSIGSIIIQKVLLSIVSSVFFKGILTVSGLSLMISLATKHSLYSQALIRFFILLVFFRLSLSFMIILNSVVDNSFLASQITINYENVQGATRELDTLQEVRKQQQKNTRQLENEIVDNELQKEMLNENLVVQINVKQELQRKVNRTKLDIEKLEARLSTFEKYNIFRVDKELDSAEKSLAENQEILEQTEEWIADIKFSLTSMDEKIRDNENILAGKHSSLLDDISKTAKYIQNINILNVKEKLDFIINNILDLMALYIMKTIILPILFMYLLMKSFKLIWACEVQGLFKSELRSI